MSAHVISEVRRIVDPEAAARYRPIAAASVAAYDGRYHLLTGDVTALEGEWPEGQRVVVIEFPSMGRALEWYRSPEYAEALPIGEQAFERRLVVVPGLE